MPVTQYEPAGQDVHAGVVPVPTAENVPAEQSEGVIVLPVQYLPPGQGVQVASTAPPVE